MIVNTGAGQFVRKVDEWRRDLRMSHSQFAAFLGVSKSEWSMVFNGVRQPSDRLKGLVLEKKPEFGYFLALDLAERAAQKTAA